MTASASRSSSRRLSIAFLSDKTVPFYMGGYEARLWEIARRLAARGHDVHVFTSCPEDTTIEGVRFHRVLPKLSYVRANGFRRLHVNALYALALLPRILTRARFDVVDVNSIPWLHLPSAFLFARKARARFIVSAHEAFSSAMPTYFDAKRAPLARLQAKAAMAFYRWSQGLADDVIATSPSCIAGLRSEGYRGPIVLGNSGQDHEPESAIDFTRTELRLAFTGRIVQMKRLDVLLDAVHALGDPVCHIVGDGPMLAALRERAKRLGLERTIFHGFVTNDEKRRILLDSNVFVMPSYREGWSLSTLESMAHGCVPVYGYRPERYATGIAEYTEAGVNALRFDGSPASLVRALTTLRDDPALLERLRRGAWAKSADFSWDASLARIEAAYEGRRFDPTPSLA